MNLAPAWAKPVAIAGVRAALLNIEALIEDSVEAGHMGIGNADEMRKQLEALRAEVDRIEAMKN